MLARPYPFFLSRYLPANLPYILGASKVSSNLYCNSRTSVLGRLRDYLRLLMKRSVYRSIAKEGLEIGIRVFGPDP